MENTLADAQNRTKALELVGSAGFGTRHDGAETAAGSKGAGNPVSGCCGYFGMRGYRED